MVEKEASPQRTAHIKKNKKNKKNKKKKKKLKFVAENKKVLLYHKSTNPLLLNPFQLKKLSRAKKYVTPVTDLVPSS